MLINKLKLINFRNFDNVEIEFNKNINLLYGSNAQGKTNIVEAIGFLSTLKSFRKVDNISLIKTGCEFATIQASDEKNNIYKVVISKEKKKMFINNDEVKKQNDFIGLIKNIIFSPDDCLFYKLTPTDRREEIDDEIKKISPAYSFYLSEYNRVKFQKNKELENTTPNKELILTYNTLLAKYGVLICKQREQYINEINKVCNSLYEQISGSKDFYQINYYSDFNSKNEKECLELINYNYNNEQEKKISLVGTHRDDFIGMLNENEIATHCSQGQNRLAVISLKLSILKVLEKYTGEKGIVILDDVLSELDEQKKKFIFDMLNESNQIFITNVDDVDLNYQMSKFEIKNGMVGGM